MIAVGALFTVCYATTVFGQTGVITGDSVNVRTGPSAGASVIMFLNLGDQVEIESQDGDFYRVAVNGTQDLYVNGDYLRADGDGMISGQFVSLAQASEPSASGQYAVVKPADGLNIRTEPSEYAEILMCVPHGVAVDVLNNGDKWVRVQYDNETGFMAKEYLTLMQGQKPDASSDAEGGDGSRADSLITYARRFLGTPYRWAGTNLNSGVDCSGFVYSVYKHFGITLNRTSSSMASNGTRVNRADLRTGDLIFFDTSGANNGRISHVGIYIGNGQFIHSSSARKTWGVSLSSLNEATYSRQFVTASRILS